MNIGRETLKREEELEKGRKAMGRGLREVAKSGARSSPMKNLLGYCWA